MLSGHAKGEGRDQRRRARARSLSIKVPRFPLLAMILNRPLIVPTDSRTSFRVFRNYKLPPQLVAFQKRFRLLELPLPEIRSEFDRQTSNAGMLQSGMPHLARFQEFHRLSTRRHRVLLRQSEGLKRKILGPSRTSLLWLIFSPVAFVFSS